VCLLPASAIAHTCWANTILLSEDGMLFTPLRVNSCWQIGRQEGEISGLTPTKTMLYRQPWGLGEPFLLELDLLGSRSCADSDEAQNSHKDAHTPFL